LGIISVIFVLGILLFQSSQQEMQEGVIRIRASAQDFYEESIRYDVKALQAIMHTLKTDNQLNVGLARGDRVALLERTGPLFSQLKNDFSVTHLYFSDLDRVNLLRVHAPLRYGDTIDRITTLQAERSGTISYGVELGALGTFTLRLVMPWFDESHKLIGYVELGMEIDQVLEKLRDFFDVQTVMLINKQYLEQGKWEDGMRTLGRTPDWDRFLDVVTSTQSVNTLPFQIIEPLISHGINAQKPISELIYQDRSYRITALPLYDAGGRKVAHLKMLTDVSEKEQVAHHIVFVSILAMAIAGGILFTLFYWLVGRIGYRIECSEKELEKLAHYDELTGLYNRRVFQDFLDEELSRTKRNNNSVALLMLDIDYFKLVNDNYGHLAGDAVLRGLSERLVSQVRNIDRVCRYGGEEIAIIMPETNKGALVMAERLRAIVEDQSFDIGDGKQINVTVSIGVATFPVDADSCDALVAAADTMLYAAKEGGRNKVCIYGKDTPPITS